MYTSLIPDADVFLDTHDTAGPVNVNDTATVAPYAVALLPPESNDDEPVDQFEPSYTIADASFSHTPAPTGSASAVTACRADEGGSETGGDGEGDASGDGSGDAVGAGSAADGGPAVPGDAVGTGEVVGEGAFSTVGLGDGVTTDVAGAGGDAAGVPTGVNEATSSPPMAMALPNMRCPH